MIGARANSPILKECNRQISSVDPLPVITEPACLPGLYCLAGGCVWPPKGGSFVINRLHALTFLVVLVLAAVAQAQTFTVLYNFTGSSDGGYPYGGLVQDADGNLYGAANVGGASNFGVVFKVDPQGTETVLYSFAGGTDGESPYGGVILDTAGNLYGTTYKGGASNYGTVFKVSKAGKETVLHSFAGGSADGCNPGGGLILDAKGNLYGDTQLCGASNYGTVFKVSKA